MTAFLIVMMIVCFATRLYLMMNMWKLPLKNGAQFFLSQQVEAGFYEDGGTGLMRWYRLSSFLPLVLDAPLALWLIGTQRLGHAFFEQWLAIVITLVIYNLMVAHFAAGAGTIARRDDDVRPATIQLSISPRRLRDQTSAAVEITVVAAVLAALVLFARNYIPAVAFHNPDWTKQVGRQAVFLSWAVYAQIGLLLLKVVYVRWRMPLPINRTDDFRRWRAAWLRWHMKMIDSIRVMFALGMVWGIFRLIYGESWSHGVQVVLLSAWLIPIALSFRHISREGRRFKEAEKELKPVEMVKEFPRLPIPEGRFFAAARLYFNRDNPAILVGSPAGLAINLASSVPYIWVSYLIGLAFLTMRLLR